MSTGSEYVTVVYQVFALTACLSFLAALVREGNK